MTRPKNILALLVMLAIARHAHAQGTSGIFPDPIAGRDLDAYAARLAMSPQQRLAVDRFHEAYLDEAQALRTGPIQAFLDASGNIMRTFMFAPDAEKMRDSLRELNRINDRIRAADVRLFDQIQSVLSDDQIAALPRVRDLRDRERLLGGVVRYLTYAHPVLRTDLSMVAGDLDLSSQDRTVLEPLLADYEARLTMAARRLAKETTGMFAEIIEGIEALGLDESPDGRTRRRSAWNELRAIWAEAGEGAIEAASTLADVNRRSARNLASALSREGGRRLTDEFRRRAFRDVHAGSRLSIDRYNAALALPDLEPERLRVIEASRDALVVRHDQLAEKMIDVLEKMQRQAMLRRFGGGDTPDAATLKTLEAERDAVNAQALAALEAILGAEGMDALSIAASQPTANDDIAAKAAQQAASSRAGAAGRRGRGSAPVASRAVPRRPDPFLPEAVSENEIAGWSGRLELSDDQGEVLRSLHQEYLTKFEALRATRIDDIVDRATNLWVIEPQSGRLLPPGPAAIDALFGARRETFASIRALDNALIDDIGLVVVARDDAARQAAISAVRRARERITYNIGVDARTGMPFGTRGGTSASHESSLDLAVLFDETDPSTETRRPVAVILDPYERTLVDLLKQRYELALDYAREHESIRAAASHARDGAGDRLDVGAAFRRLSDGLGADLRRTSGAIVELNRTTLDALVAALPANAIAPLRTAYRRVANPGVFEDRNAVGPLFQEALGLDGLDDGQRARLGELFAEYRADYDRLNEALVALDRAQAEASADGRSPDWQRRQKHRDARERLQFQRRELNDRVFRRLRAGLSEDQATRLGIGGG